MLSRQAINKNWNDFLKPADYSKGNKVRYTESKKF